LINLEQIFKELIVRYTSDAELSSRLWLEILNAHSQRSRYYHNLSHLENIYQQISCVKGEIEDWDIMLFALFYHDYIYNVYKKDNEEKSALYAKNVLQKIGVNTEPISSCYAIILATKGHTINKNNDTNIFTDADLSILGFPKNEYIQYLNQVRKEYKMYPNLLYNPNRKKVLESFLEMEHIYKTPYFIDNFEQQARKNLQYEIGLY